MHIHQYGVLELSFERGRGANGSGLEPLVRIELIRPDGGCRCIRGFWDGGATWRARISPDMVGRWSWQAIGESNGDLLAQGVFECVPYEGDHPLYAHGPLRVAASGRYLEHADGRPFFWLGDTAWNGVIRSDDEHWARYLRLRAAQRFSVIQFVANRWRGDEEDPAGERAYTSAEPLQINPRFFQRLDRRVAMINEYGLIAAPVVLWALLPTDPGQCLSEGAATQLAAYVVARYDAYQVAWLLGGDAPYQKIGVERWKRIAREVFRWSHARIVSLHPNGLNWVGEEFRSEPWFSFIGYQSGHGSSENDLAWLLRGPPAVYADKVPPKPIINLEPNYETALAYESGKPFTDYHVRRAAWWSLLVSPTAGITYGHQSIWVWNFETGPAEGHSDLLGGVVLPWETGLETAGIHSMTVLRGIIDRLYWTTLRPAPDVLAEQPGDRDWTAFQVAARDAWGTLVVYAPRGGIVRFSSAPPSPVRRVDPRTGDWEVISAETAIQLPQDQDWLIVAGPGWRD